jgi:hypothetical protein
MRITSAGNVGIGTSSPTFKLEVNQSGTGIVHTDGTRTFATYLDSSGIWLGSRSNNNLQFYTNNGAVQLTLNTSGNLGLGVTPSAWSGYLGFDMSSHAGLGSYLQNITVNSNAYFGGAGWTYKSTLSAGQYLISGNSHQWKIAPSGTAGNAITFTQAMTLDASGRLLVGKTSTDANNWGIQNYSAAGAFQSGIQLTYGGVGASAMWVPAGAGLAFGVDFASGTTERMRITASGNVGIGTTSPSQILEIGNGSVAGQQIRMVGSTSNAVGAEITNSIRFGAGQWQSVFNNNNFAWEVGRTKTASSFDGRFSIYSLNRVSDAESKVERLSIDGSGNLAFNSGYGSAATAYGCRAWVNFNGTGTVAIRASGNVSSITDNGTGDYTVNFSTAMPDANYAPTYGCGTTNTGGSWDYPGGTYQTLTTSLRMRTYNTDNTNLIDTELASVAIFR